MNIKPLKIGELQAKIPLIQGGMGVGISLGNLAGAVANEGGVGIISTAQIGFKEKDFYVNTLAANLRAIEKELKKARKIAPKGILGFNIRAGACSSEGRGRHYYFRRRTTGGFTCFCARLQNKNSPHCIR